MEVVPRHLAKVQVHVTERARAVTFRGGGRRRPPPPTATVRTSSLVGAPAGSLQDRCQGGHGMSPTAGTLTTWKT
jgi:hypothetical protein